MDIILKARFKKTGKLAYVDPLKYGFRIGDSLIANSERGEEIARVVKIIPKSEVPSNVKVVKIIKPATKHDMLIEKENDKKAELVTKYCKEQAQKLGLKMKVLFSEYTFDLSKLVIYFSAEERVDFRELVKILANQYKVRIELRQVGPRDEIKSYCNLGMCGKEVCCRTFLQDFEPVTIKMAKDQGLQINMPKLSGACGRLMCCLKYEDETYKENLSKLPKVGQIVKIKESNEQGKVVNLNILSKKTRIRIGSPGEDERYEDYTLEQIEFEKAKENTNKNDEKK